MYESVSALMTVIMMMMMMMMEMVTSTPDLTMFPSSLIAGTHGPVRGIDRVAGNGAGQPSDAAAAITVLTPDTGYKLGRHQAHEVSTNILTLFILKQRHKGQVKTDSVKVSISITTSMP